MTTQEMFDGMRKELNSIAKEWHGNEPTRSAENRDGKDSKSEGVAKRSPATAER